jgi:hypothetical protein
MKIISGLTQIIISLYSAFTMANSNQMCNEVFLNNIKIALSSGQGTTVPDIIFSKVRNNPNRNFYETVKIYVDSLGLSSEIIEGQNPGYFPIMALAIKPKFTSTDTFTSKDLENEHWLIKIATILEQIKPGARIVYTKNSLFNRTSYYREDLDWIGLGINSLISDTTTDAFIHELTHLFTSYTATFKTQTELTHFKNHLALIHKEFNELINGMPGLENIFIKTINDESPKLRLVFKSDKNTFFRDNKTDFLETYSTSITKQ